MSLIEPYIPYLFLSGVAVAALGLVALLVAAFLTGIRWGFGVLLFLPVLGPAFAWKYPRRGLAPLTSLVLGLVAAATPAIASRLIPVDLGSRERIVDGERHLTLTGWDRKSYSVLRSKSDAVVLQMANADVNDDTLAYIEGMSRLRELDLSDTGITDAGLRRLENLDQLERLRLSRTGVTDAGLRGLPALPALRQLDLRGTAVGQELIDEWKAGGEGRRAMR